MGYVEEERGSEGGSTATRSMTYVLALLFTLSSRSDDECCVSPEC